jgi:ABC-type branched-subunit amino acid transport system ATPase component/branched-subunit amino acid ABC-type transport system permease component
MSAYYPFIIIGLVTGSVYGLAGMGLVLTYKTSGVLNFGYGAVAALGAFFFYFLNTQHHVPWGWAAALTIGIFAPLLGLALEYQFRALAGASDSMKVVGTVGLILIAEGISQLWNPLNAPTFTPFLSQSSALTLLGVEVTWEEVILIAISLAASSVLFWFFRYVRLGVVMRGVVDNSDLVSMSGDDPIRVRRWASIIGAVFAVVAGLMLAPYQPLDAVTLATVVFAAFGAAAAGLFTSLPMTFIGGLAIGIAGALTDKFAATISWIGGLPASLPFLLLLAVLIVTPARRLVQRRPLVQPRVRDTYKAPVRIRLGAGIVVIVFLAVVPSFAGVRLALWSSGLIDIILFLSIGLLVRRAGQISMCQLAFAAVGAASFGHFMDIHGMPWLVALLLASLISVPIGALLAIPAVRVSGVFLALATLGFAILAQDVFYLRGYMFTSSEVGIYDPRPDFSIGSWHLSTDTGFYYLLLLIVILVVVGVTALSSGRLGRLLEAMTDSQQALETQGATTSVLKVIVFCIASFMASLAGALTGMLYHYSVGTYFGPFDSIYLVVIVLVITVGDPWYAIIGAITYTLIPGYIQSASTSAVLLLIFGFISATAVLHSSGGTTPARLRAFLDRLGGVRQPSPETGAPATLVTAPVGVQRKSTPRADVSTPSSNQGGLVVRDLHVHFGGVRAVNGVSVEARPGMITGLIGPNGAGKTTLFNACSGLTRITSGEVLFHGIDVTRERPARRAREGLGRTFQRPDLFNSLTVRQNVAIGREASLGGRNPLSQIIGSRRANQLITSVVDEAMVLTNTTRLANTQVGLLPTGQRRLVELARALAGPFDLFLLDEPSSGLDVQETEQFGQVLKTVVAERGSGIFLVEHDMTLVREICDRVFVVDFGQLIFEGTAEEMQNAEVVRAAYLGDASVTTSMEVSATSEAVEPLKADL